MFIQLPSKIPSVTSLFTSLHQCRDEISVDFIIIIKFIFLSYVFLLNIISFENNKILFLIEINFFSAGVIEGLVLNFGLYLVIFLNWVCLPKILFMESKKF